MGAEEVFSPNKRSKHYLANASTVVLAGAWSYQLKSEEFKRVLQAFVKNYTPSKEITLMLQVPYLAKNPIRSQRFLNLRLAGKSEMLDTHRLANRYLAKNYKELHQVKLLDPTQLAMFLGVPMHEGGLVYFDQHHLNEFGAREYAKSVSQKSVSFFSGR